MHNEPENESAGFDDAPLPAPIRRHVSVPFPFDLIIQLDDAGELHGLGQQASPAMDRVEYRQIQRATLYIGGLVQAAQMKGEGPDKVMAGIPDHPLFAVERTILTEVVAQQFLHRRVARAASAGLADLVPEGSA